MRREVHAWGGYLKILFHPMSGFIAGSSFVPTRYTGLNLATLLVFVVAIATGGAVAAGRAAGSSSCCQTGSPSIQILMHWLLLAALSAAAASAGQQLAAPSLYIV